MSSGKRLTYFRDTSTRAWQFLPALNRNPAANTITVQLNHLSGFALPGSSEARFTVYLSLVLRNN